MDLIHKAFYVKGELIPLVKGSLEEKLSYQQKLRSRIVQALVDSLYQKADIKDFISSKTAGNVL